MQADARYPHAFIGTAGLTLIMNVFALTAFMVISMSASATAQEYSQLQVLLPGETPAPGTGTGKLGTPDDQTVGVPFVVWVRACDDDWNTVVSITNVIEFDCTDATASLPGPTALVEGEALLPVTLNAAGDFTFSASDMSDPTIPEAASAAVTALALEGFEFSRINQKNQYAGVPMTITVTAVDGIGQVVEGFSGTVNLREITSYGEGRIEPAEITLSGGSWSGDVTMYRADETSINRGNVDIVAQLEADPTKNGTSDPFTVHPGPLARVQIVVPGQSPAPGSVEGVVGSPATQSASQDFTAEVFATDDYWNPLPCSHVVRITSSDLLATTPVTGTLEDGYRQFTLSLGTVGTQTLTVTDQSDGTIQGMTSAGIAVIPSAPDHFEIEPFPVPVAAGDSVQVTIRATDVAGNTLPDFSGDAILSANTGPGSISPEGMSFSEGTWTGYIIFRGAGGSVSFTCADFATPPHIGTSESFQVLPGPYTALQLLLPGQTPQGGTETGCVGEPDDQNAGSEFSLTIRAVDAFWNRVSGVTDRIALCSSDPFASITSDTTLANGELLVPATLFRAGSQTITASSLDSTGITPHTSEAVEVYPGPYSRLLILAPGEESAPGTPEGRTGSAIDQSINFAFRVTVFATDSWWNPVTGATDLVRITSSDPLAELPPDTSLAGGEIARSVRLSTGGFQTITVSNLTQPSVPSSTTQVRMISSGFHLEAEVIPTAVQAGEPFTLTVKVTNDAGSVMEEINSSVEVEVQNASTGEPGRGTLLNTRFQLIQGQRSVAETYTFAENIILIVRDDAGNEPAVSEPVSVSPGAPAAVQLTSDPPWIRANRHASVIARVIDGYDNGVPAQPVRFALLGGEGTLTAIDTLTWQDGSAQADFLSPRAAGVSRIRATSNELAAEIEIETALVDPSLPGGTITNYPNPFHPDEAPTTIAYKLADDATVSLSIYTLTGTPVLRQRFPLGTPGGLMGLNEFLWDGRNGRGNIVSSGGYIVHIKAEGAGETLHEMNRVIAVVR